ncbi:peroxiredoxin [Aminipila butyrica]|nr:peroxiredoxin [Aminipila butyrica]
MNFIMENNLTLGMTAPAFTANSTFGPLSLSDYKGSWLVFFSHPGDFTPVCTSEFIAFAQLNDQFEQINTKLLGLSIDSNPSHLAWVNSIYEVSGVQIPFPIVVDRVGDIAREYGMIAPDVSTQTTVRSVFIIDPDQKIRAILTYPLTNGRNIPEIFRLVTAMQTTDAEHVLTPANWRPGNPVMVPAPNTYQELLERQTNAEAMGLICNDWYWCYKIQGSEEEQE